MNFISDDFLLSNDVASELYHGTAKDLPIIDYHCHLPPADVAANRQFKNLFESWLEGDHYKWRAMRTNGVEERFCTGDADPFDKFKAFATTLPECLRNPLYHWCHMELKRYFGYDGLLNEHTAEEVWKLANSALAGPELSAHGILAKFKVSVVCTTDDPTDTLDSHQKIAASGIGTRIYPTFRPDKAMALADLDGWNAWTDKLAALADCECGDLNGFRAALRKRHDFFHEMGGRLSDHGLVTCFADFPDEPTATAIFAKARARQPLSPTEQNQLGSFLMVFFGELDAEKGWVKQLHLGAMRNVNTALFKKLGPDIGCDSVSDAPQGEALAAYLGKLSSNGRLPKTILYNLNPRDNYLFATMIGNFQGGGVAGKMQFGSGWWFLDQEEGMRWQINALSNLGLLGRFVGMLTDSRSFMSYPRHEYFRRILCDMIGTDVVSGRLPRDMDLLKHLVHGVCYGNAASYFGFELGTV